MSHLQREERMTFLGYKNVIPLGLVILQFVRYLADFISLHHLIIEKTPKLDVSTDCDVIDDSGFFSLFVERRGQTDARIVHRNDTVLFR